MPWSLHGLQHLGELERREAGALVLHCTVRQAHEQVEVLKLLESGKPQHLQQYGGVVGKEQMTPNPNPS